MQKALTRIYDQARAREGLPSSGHEGKGRSKASTLGRYAAPATFASCACVRTYDRAEWAKLRFVGLQVAGGPPTLEMRNCSCGSTLSIEVA